MDIARLSARHWSSTTKLFETARPAATDRATGRHPGGTARHADRDSSSPMAARKLTMWDGDRLAPPVLQIVAAEREEYLPSGRIEDGLRLVADAADGTRGSSTRWAVGSSCCRRTRTGRNGSDRPRSRCLKGGRLRAGPRDSDRPGRRRSCSRREIRPVRPATSSTWSAVTPSAPRRCRSAATASWSRWRTGRSSMAS